MQFVGCKRYTESLNWPSLMHDREDEMTQNWLTTLPKANCFLLLLRPPMWRVQSVGRCCGYRNVCDPVSRRKHDTYAWKCWTYESHRPAAWATFRRTPIASLWDGRIKMVPVVERWAFLPFCCLLYKLLGAVWRILLCFFFVCFFFFCIWWRWTDEQCGHPADEDLGSRGGKSLEEQTFKRLRTHRGRYRKKYIYLYIYISAFYSGLLFTKGKKSELKMLQYFPSERTRSSVWRIRMNWL